MKVHSKNVIQTVDFVLDYDIYCNMSIYDTCYLIIFIIISFQNEFRLVIQTGLQFIYTHGWQILFEFIF